MAFGPDTDVIKVKKILQNIGQDDNDRIIFYRKNGFEVACSIQCRCSHTASGEAVSSLAILSYTPTTAAYELQTNFAKTPITTSSFEPGISRAAVDPASLINDPGLLIHLNAIRRIRRASIS